MAMFRIRWCTVYPIRTVYLSANNRNVHLHVLHVHATHVIHSIYRKKYLIVVQGNINAQRNVADVLNPHDLPSIRQHGPGVTLKQDNARPHVARVTTQLLQQNNVNGMPWPAVSPDLNPIEHIWDQLCRKARAYHQIDNVRDLTRALQQEWRNLPNALILRYVTSMRRRIIACIHANCDHIRY